MEKRAKTDHPVLDVIERRWSPRAFDPRPVPADALRSMFEAARWAASSYNEQPWRYVVAVRGQEPEFERMLGCLVEFNRDWARHAGAVALSYASKRFSRNDKPNAHGWHDVGQATAYLALQATELGLFVHQMAGIDRDACRATWDVPDEFEPVAAFAVGYPGDADSLPDDLRKQERSERTRRKQSEIVFSGTWGSPASW